VLSGKQNEKTLLEAVRLTCIIWKSFVRVADFGILWSILNTVAALEKAKFQINTSGCKKNHPEKRAKALKSI